MLLLSFVSNSVPLGLGAYFVVLVVVFLLFVFDAFYDLTYARVHDPYCPHPFLHTYQPSHSLFSSMYS